MTKQMPIAGFVITFREALEAALIVGIVAAYLKKVGCPEATRYLILGAASAAGVSVVFAWILQAAYGGLVGAYESLFEGLTALTAAGFLTYMIFWMTRNARKYKGELERKLDLALTSGQLLGVAAVAFVKGSYRLNLHVFFKYTSMILLVFAAGLASFASHELAETAETLGFDIGIFGEHAFDVNIAPNNIFHEDGALGSLLYTLFGNTLSPEWIRLAVYLGYWVIMGGYLLLAYRTSSTKSVRPA